MVTLQLALVDDLESLAQLYDELIDEPTDRSKMKENFRLMEANPNYVAAVA